MTNQELALQFDVVFPRYDAEPPPVLPVWPTLPNPSVRAKDQTQRTPQEMQIVCDAIVACLGTQSMQPKMIRAVTGFDKRAVTTALQRLRRLHRIHGRYWVQLKRD